MAAAATAVSLGLAACGDDTSTSGSQHLTWYINPDAGGQAAIAQKCTDESGGRYTIETSLLPSDAASQREQLARERVEPDRHAGLPELPEPVHAVAAGRRSSRRPDSRAVSKASTPATSDGDWQRPARISSTRCCLGTQDQVMCASSPSSTKRTSSSSW